MMFIHEGECHHCESLIEEETRGEYDPYLCSHCDGEYCDEKCLDRHHCKGNTREQYEIEKADTIHSSGGE